MIREIPIIEKKTLKISALNNMSLSLTSEKRNAYDLKDQVSTSIIYSL